MERSLALTMAASLIASVHPGHPAFGAPVTSTAGGVPARGSAGCGTVPPVTPGKSARFTLRVGELDREYRVHLPPDYDSRRPVSLVLDFHGYTGDAAGEELHTGLSAHADRHGYVVVYPQSTGFLAEDGQAITSWNDLAGSASPGPEGPICSEDARKYPHPPECGAPTPCNWASCHDDLGFVEKMLDRLEETLCVDRDRVYATGMSNGGMFVHRLGCAMPERFAAIAPVGGTLARGFNCAPGRSTPLSLMNVYGSRDDYVSQRGGVSSDGYSYTSAEDVMRRWAGPGSQDCDRAATRYPTSLDGTLDFACTQRARCSSGAEVVHCTWNGAHEWPGAGTVGLANEIVWEFFSRHTRPAGPRVHPPAAHD
jgi:polyhydroxybutyrate depolymerase